MQLVIRPQVISSFSKYSNKVDTHNQVRKFDIGLEKKWITQKPYFKLYTTQDWMVLTYFWKAFRENNVNEGTITAATEFLDIIVFAMIQEALKFQTPENEIKENQ